MYTPRPPLLNRADRAGTDGCKLTEPCKETRRQRWSAVQFIRSLTSRRQGNPFPRRRTISPLTQRKYQCKVYDRRAPSTPGTPAATADKRANHRKRSSSSWQYQNNCEGFRARGMAPDSAMSCSLLKSKKDADCGD